MQRRLARERTFCYYLFAMLKIRLQRVGRKNDPAFRVVVVDSAQSITSNKSVEQVGFYNPKSKERSLNAERITYWIENAQPSDTVHNMLVKENIITGKTRNVLPQKSPVKKEGDDAVEEKATPAEAETSAEETPSEEPVQETPEEPVTAEEKKEEAEAPQEAPTEEEINTEA